MIVVTVDRDTWDIYTSGVNDDEVILTHGIHFYYRLNENVMLHYQAYKSDEYSELYNNFINMDCAVIEITNMRTLSRVFR